MGQVFTRGVPVSLLENFFTVDPITKVATPATPATVRFTILAPDNTEQVFNWPGDAEITQVAANSFVCKLSPPLPPGDYRYLVNATGAESWAREDEFTVLASGVLDPVPSGVATPGPCSSWIDGEAVNAAGPDLVDGETWKLDDVAYMGSDLLYELSGRQFPGVCERTVRPCRDNCNCWGGGISSGLPFYWTAPWTVGAAWSGWRNECGETCGCGSESYVLLAGYPVREILEVKIDGNILSSSGEYRLDDRRKLIRLADLMDPNEPVDRAWPGCQDIALPDTEPGTFSVKYTWGSDVPALGRYAAAMMARELWAALNGDKCKLPTRVTRVVRQGIEFDKLVPTADLLRSGTTGIALVDAFLAAYNPTKAKRRSAVFSPDTKAFAKKVGQT